MVFQKCTKVTYTVRASVLNVDTSCFTEQKTSQVKTDWVGVTSSIFYIPFKVQMIEPEQLSGYWIPFKYF